MTRFFPDPKPEPRKKKQPKPLKRSAIKKKYKATGEGIVFAQIWKERPHKSFINQENLGNDAMAFMFIHVLSKAQNKYPKFKLYKKNIVLGTQEQHFLWDQGLRSELKLLPEWNKMFELEAELKEEYKNIAP